MISPAPGAASDDGPVELVRLADVRRRPMRWLWPGRIPMGSLTVLDGDPGSGKTLVAADLTIRTAGGFDMPSGPAGVTAGAGARVLYIGLDDQVEALAARLDAAGGDAKANVYLWPDRGSGDDALSMPLHTARVTASISGVEAALVVVDTLVRTADDGLKLEVYQDATKIVGAWDDVARATGAAVVLVNHRTKVAGADSMSRGYGSKGGVAGVARSMLGVSRDYSVTDGSRRFFLESVKASYSDVADRLAFRILGVGVPGVDDDGNACVVTTACVDWLPDVVPSTAGEVRAKARATTNASDEAHVRTALAGGPLSREALDERLVALGVSRDRVERVRKAHAVARRKVGTANVWEFVPRVASTSGASERDRSTVDDDDVDDFDLDAVADVFGASLIGARS